MRYAVFAGSAYYPLGGWGDYKGSFSSLQAAQECAQGAVNFPEIEDWSHVIDIETGIEMGSYDNGLYK